MIIYGTKTTELGKRNLKGKCLNCGAENSIELHFFQKYAHIFWIPFFPTNKLGVSQCGHCRQVLKQEEFPSALTNEFRLIKAQTKTPVWTFSGLAFAVVFIGMAMLNSKATAEKNSKFILSPQSGDVFEVKLKDDQYTLFKVDNVKNDTVFVRFNNYETNKWSGLYDLKKKEYAEDLFGYSKAELKEMFDKGDILNINRE
jgi:hypothetical protein